MQSSQLVKFVVLVLIVFSIPGLACSKKNDGSDSTQKTSTAQFENDIDKVSYIIGVQIGQDFKRNYIEDVNVDMIARAIQDVLDDKTPAISESEMGTIMETYGTELRAKQEVAQAQEMTKNQAEASAFLASNALKPEIITLPDSLQYQILKEGTGPLPKATDMVKAHYRGSLLNGTEFDSSYSRNEPVEFNVSGMIPGWTEVLQLMKVGSQWKVFIPPQLAYGEQGNRVIPPNSLLVFEIELLEIVKE